MEIGSRGYASSISDCIGATGKSFLFRSPIEKNAFLLNAFSYFHLEELRIKPLSLSTEHNYISQLFLLLALKI